MKRLLLGLCLIIISALLTPWALATSVTVEVPIVAPQPTSCLTGTFTSSGDIYWRNMMLTVTNRCGRAIDFQDATITFVSGSAINTEFWGDFSPLSWPEGNRQITSTLQSDGTFLASLHLHFNLHPGSNTVLPARASFEIEYGVAQDRHRRNSALVYVGGTPAGTGTIALRNASVKPSNVVQNYALIHISMNGQPISDVQLPWNSIQNISNLMVGQYTISAENVITSSGLNYQGTAVPSTVNVIADQVRSSVITYTANTQVGRAAIRLSALPPQLSGYTGRPTALLTRSDTGSAVSQILTWNATTIISSLANGARYNLSTPLIIYNGYACQPTFTPSSVVANATAIPIASLSFRCTPTAQNIIRINVTGAPTTLSSYLVTLTPNNGGSAVTSLVALSNGSGSSTINLPNNVIYTVSSSPVSGYSISYNPQPLTSIPNAIETITLSQSGGTTPVAINGQLRVCGTQLCNKNGVPIQLRGMSTHGLQWYGWGICVTPNALNTLVNTWKSNVVRLALYVQEEGYATDPTGFTNQMNTLITEATNRGMYVIVDWHILNPGDPNFNLARARTFFSAIANANRGKVNLIYEIANQPSGVSWATIKSYAEQIIPVIRAIDPNAVIIVGTRGWSSLGLADGNSSIEVINNPVNATNIMYVFHFYAASHGDNYVNELDSASNVLPIFVSEWGSQAASGDGPNNFSQTDQYIQLMFQKKISWTNWNWSDDPRSGAVWNPGACSSNTWPDSSLKPSGGYVKSKIINGI